MAFFGVFETGNSATKPLLTRRPIDECLKEGMTDQERVDCIRGTIRDVREEAGQGTNAASAIATFIGLVTLGVGAVVSSPYVILTGIVVTSVGTITSYTNSAVNQQNSDTFLNNDGEGYDCTEYKLEAEHIVSHDRYGVRFKVFEDGTIDIKEHGYTW